MAVLRLLVLGAVAGWVGYLGWRIMEVPPAPYLDPNPWWGPGERKPEDTSIRQFQISVPQEDIEDLERRLSIPLRLTPALEGANFTYGFNADTLKAIVQYWRTNYDWKKREARLNAYPHFKTQIEGLDIHFLRARARSRPGVTVLPLLLVHGWPGSVIEFYNMLPLLTNEHQDGGVAFEVICPSIPGYVFSQASSKQGLGVLETAQIFLKLMRRLGYEQFFTQGGDWGSMIVTAMATLYPEHVLGVHVNMVLANTMGSHLRVVMGSILPSGLLMTQEEQDKLYPLQEKFNLLMRETGYMHIQSSKPDTIGAALNQHPASLAVYILEKFSTWTHSNNPHLPDGGLLQSDFPIPLDEMLDNICLYWFTGCITSSVRYYAETLSKFFTRTVDKKNPLSIISSPSSSSPLALITSIPCHVPAGLAVFPEEILNHPKSIVQHKYYDIVSYRDQPAGGHFAAMERPHLLATDFHAFVREVLKRHL